MSKYERKKQAKQRLELLKQQLRLTVLYPESFLENLGKQGTDELINNILDEMNRILKYLKDEN